MRPFILPAEVPTAQLSLPFRSWNNIPPTIWAGLMSAKATRKRRCFKINGSAEKLIEFLDGSKKRFVIPVYQRNYDWRIEQCSQLYDDLVKVIRCKRKSHFFGSIVASYNPDGKYMEFMVIDGQQRLTTVSLLLLAMYHLLERGIVTSQSDSMAEEILEDFLVDKHQKDQTRMKLKPVKNDQKAFLKLFGDPKAYIMDSNITINYDYFYRRIQKNEITIDELYDAIYALVIIHIKLNKDDDAQLIFESLNSTGLALSEGDKIRNLILMGEEPKKQEEYYENYWNKIEICTDYDVSSFVRDFLSIKMQAIPAQSKVYLTFKNYRENNHWDTESLLKELLKYARWYQTLLRPDTKRKGLNGCIDRLNRLETTVTRPFFLEVMRIHGDGKLNLDEMEEIFRITENYLYRRTICELPTNVLNKIFSLLHNEIQKYDGSEEDYVEKFKYALLSKREKGRFPDDSEFASAFAQKQIYNMNSKNKIYTLERLENFGTKEDKDVYRHCEEGDYSIEHIMPQHLTPAWVKELGNDYREIHDIWLHRIANLTLTAYNSKYSNRSFYEKKTMENGFSDSGIRLNTWIAGKERWTLEELKERSTYLTKQALKLWALPATDYKPAEKQLDSYTLEDEEELTGRLIAKFCFKNTEQPVTSWADMFQKVLQILYGEDKMVLAGLAASNSDGLAQYFSTKEDAFSKNVRIGEDIYVLIHTSTQSKLALLKRLFKLYGEALSGLVFYLRDEEKQDSDGQEKTELTYDRRKKYWAYALELIRKTHGENGSFSKVNPTKDNWINGFFGINGCYLCCVANYDHARVEIVLRRPDDNENKALFDLVYAHRQDIETIMNAELQWDKGDKETKGKTKKSSKIYLQLNHVSIERETDWPQMAEFHAQWTKKFLDVIVPYLKGGQ